MMRQYFTQKGSTYIYQVNDAGTAWFKRDHTGTYQPLAGAVHLPRTRLQELLREYPRSVLDTTVCFGDDLAKEFFEDAKREHLKEIPEGTETNIFFLLNKGEGRYAIGYSSVVQRIETVDTTKTVKTTEQAD